MLFYLLMLFTLVPLAELALLIWIGSHTSVLFTIGLVLVTGVVGASLARWQGWRTVQRIQNELRAGRMPADAMVDGLLIVVAGAVLITPGVLTDAAGFALLVPPLRQIIKRQVAASLKRHIRVETQGVGPFRTEQPGGDRIIDAEVIETRVEDAK